MKKGDTIELQKQDVKVEECKECKHLMVNLDADEVKEGDLVTLKRKGVRISNPETEELYCLKCDIEAKPSFREKLSTWFEDTKDENDSSFFSTSSSGGLFGGSSGGGGFGGFGGGGFSGGGASRGF